MVALIEHFVASGDLILHNSSPKDHSQYFAEYYRDHGKNDDPFSYPFLIHNIAASFTQHSFLRGVDVEHSEQLLDAVKMIKETHSLETVQNSYSDWTEWVAMLETIEKEATLATCNLRDLSFLQSSCLRATLLSLQTKHQLRANLPPTEKNNETVNSSDESHTSITHLPFLPDVNANWMNISSSHLSSTISTPISLPSSLLSSFDHRPSSADSSSLFSSAISTRTALPSDQSSSDSRKVASDQLVIHSDSITRHSRQILSAIHLHLTRPPPTSFPWNVRPSIKSESELDSYFQPTPQFIDQNEQFGPSLFDETDDSKIVASLRRCHAVLKTTQSTQYIVDLDTFRTFLISGLHSSNLAIQFECYQLFFALADLLPTVDDPRDSKFASLRRAFSDGTVEEQITLLRMWMRWLSFQSRSGQGQMMNVSDFDFATFLAADLSDIRLFDFVCDFVGRLFINNVVSMSFGWRMDFLLSFEKRHQMMSRLSSDQCQSSYQKRSQHFLSPLALFLGSLLSVYRGCTFPSALTELVTIDLGSYPPKKSQGVNPAFFLNHTSINPKHGRSFFPMDLMFERYLRSNPNAFFGGWPGVKVCTSRKFLYTPCVGLHSLLLRCPPLNLDQQELLHLMNMLTVDLSDQTTTHKDFVILFTSFPPPRLLDTLLSPPHLDGTSFTIRLLFLLVFNSIGAFSAPFGACSSLAQVFQMLTPFFSDYNQFELDVLSRVGEIVVSLHWLSIPAHFDSPLLCHLSSPAGAQRGVLQTLSSHSGIPSLITPLPAELNQNTIGGILSEDLSHKMILLLCLLARHVASDPVASLVFEFFHRFVSVSSDAIRMDLVKQDLLDRVVFAVSNSPYLDDYEKGIAVIGILLATIRRDDQKQRMRAFDLSRVFRHSDTHPDNYKDQQ
ncbi:hypothetical protein BLNAU_9341 [Blattamonas nauphoetae]|uniref:Uncharacterized protein n=1 Tax=Blattamonas nauphoetae TaxID=2049346 RepID=A0ABQ9XW07_9EUKA|nr:hypothetical protein BLNAU_9341 [Blattamonas nauphoetae]